MRWFALAFSTIIFYLASLVIPKDKQYLWGYLAGSVCTALLFYYR